MILQIVNWPPLWFDLYRATRPDLALIYEATACDNQCAGGAKVESLPACTAAADVWIACNTPGTGHHRNLQPDQLYHSVPCLTLSVCAIDEKHPLRSFVRMHEPHLCMGD